MEMRDSQSTLRGKRALFFSIALLTLICGFTLSQWGEIKNIWSSLDFIWLLTGFCFHFLNYIFRGIRLKCSVNSAEFENGNAFLFSVFHGTLSYFMPVRSGDASLPLLLKAHGHCGLTRGVAILMKLRLIDIAVLGCLSIFGAILGARGISPTTQIVWAGSSIVLAASIYLIRFLGPLSSWLLRHMAKSFGNLGHTFTISSKEMFLSFLIWICILLSQFSMIKSIGLNLTIAEVTFISVIQFPLQLLPLQGFANSGNHEGGWVASLVFMGFETQQAMNYALISHGVIILYVIGLGVSGATFACLANGTGKTMLSFIKIIKP